jgi:hypothetical protein
MTASTAIPAGSGIASIGRVPRPQNGRCGIRRDRTDHVAQAVSGRLPDQKVIGPHVGDGR